MGRRGSAKQRCWTVRRKGPGALEQGHPKAVLPDALREPQEALRVLSHSPFPNFRCSARPRREGAPGGAVGGVRRGIQAASVL